MSGLKRNTFFAGTKKLSRCILFVFLLSLFVSTGAAAGDAGNSPTPQPSGKAIGTKAVTGARELGLLVLGVGWDAVRFVMPKSCPEREKDIDELIHSIKERK
jgi:hypothetical protein